MRLCAVGALVDLLPDRRIKPTVALGKTADPQIAVLTRYASSRNGGEIEFRRRAPADTAGYGRIVDAAENAARILSGKTRSTPVTRSRCLPKLRTCGSKPGIG